jgi:hypothetical protein
MDFFKKKKEVRDLRLPELPSAPEFPELPSESESSELPSLSQLPRLPVISSFEKSDQRPINKPFAVEIGEERRSKPVFVKIDKYKDAMANFEMVKKKLQESSSLLDKIKETRAREEEELNQWSHELNTLKEKIAMIDKKIFSSLD